MSSAATVAPGNATTADQIDACINVHRDKRSKPSIEVVYETGESVRRVCHRTDMPHPERNWPPHLCLPRQILQMLRATCTRARAGWTPELELEVLCEYWTLLAARLPATSFSFGKYDPKAVQNKLLKLRGRLKPMVYQLPYYANEDAFKRILASCKCGDGSACADEAPSTRSRASTSASATGSGATRAPCERWEQRTQLRRTEKRARIPSPSDGSKYPPTNTAVMYPLAVNGTLRGRTLAQRPPPTLERGDSI